MLGHLAAQVERVVKEDRAGGAPVLAGTGLADVAAVVDPEDLRVGLGHPHRRGCGAGGEIDGDAGLAELVDDAIEPIEVVHAFFGLKLDVYKRQSQDHTVSSIFLSEDPVLPLSPAEVEPQAATEESMATAPIRAIVFLPNFIVLSFLVMGNDGTWRFVPSIVSF